MMRVVAVEDDPLMLGHYARVCARHGIALEAAASASEAIDVIDDVSPDAVILDMMLHGGTALVLLHELQSHSDLARIPVIVVTSLADTFTTEELKPYGVKTVLDKTTMHPDDLVAALRREVTAV